MSHALEKYFSQRLKCDFECGHICGSPISWCFNILALLIFCCGWCISFVANSFLANHFAAASQPPKHSAPPLLPDCSGAYLPSRKSDRIRPWTAFLWQEIDDVSWLTEQSYIWTCILATKRMIIHLSLRQFSHIQLRMTYTYGKSVVLYSILHI